MRNKFKIASSLGAAALLLSGAAMAGPPQAFGNWTVVGGNIVDNTAACPGGVRGTGFEQCDITIGGQRYIRTRIADATFKSEDFVRIGGGGSGLASTMAITDSTTNVGTTFGTTADIMTGWAVTPATTGANDKSQAVLGLTLGTVASSSTAFDAFNATFGVTAVTDSAGVNKISALNVGQTVEMGAATDKQRFELRNVGSNQVLWAGQSVANVGDFSITTSKNLGTGAAPISKTNLGGTAVDATVWTSTFGSVPTFLPPPPPVVPAP